MGGDYSVAVLDDNPRQADTYKSVIEHELEGYKVNVYTPGDDPGTLTEELGYDSSLEAIDEDIIIADHSLPWDFTGQDLLSEAANEDVHKGVVLITNALDGFEGFDLERAEEDSKCYNTAYSTKRNVWNDLPELVEDVAPEKGYAQQSFSK